MIPTELIKPGFYGAIFTGDENQNETENYKEVIVKVVTGESLKVSEEPLIVVGKHTNWFELECFIFTNRIKIPERLG